jgi:hypothetical protein
MSAEGCVRLWDGLARRFPVISASKMSRGLRRVEHCIEEREPSPASSSLWRGQADATGPVVDPILDLHIDLP